MHPIFPSKKLRGAHRSHLRSADRAHRRLRSAFIACCVNLVYSSYPRASCLICPEEDFLFPLPAGPLVHHHDKGMAAMPDERAKSPVPPFRSPQGRHMPHRAVSGDPWSLPQAATPWRDSFVLGGVLF
uniref:Uncharacterized protein n=1 Tax=Plectus sambesii TaxID=2011161 RepID=A0A914UVZ8_9BILA